MRALDQEKIEKGEEKSEFVQTLSVTSMSTKKERGEGCSRRSQSLFIGQKVK